ncbi:MAG: hypothetical protein AAGC72_03845 [Planctomycetota bacterium]
MPRSKTNQAISNLSVTLPRDIHRKAKVNYYRSGVNVSFGAYVAWCLSQVPEQLEHESKMQLQLMELRLRCTMPRKT